MSEQTVITYDYSSVPTIRAFCQDRKHFIKAIMGPFGSGKSSGCVMDLFNIACQQQPDTKGVRRTRFAIVRNTYQVLRDTTKKTIEEWLQFALWRQYDHTFIIDIKLNDGTQVYSEWLLRALDRPDQVKNLLSWEITAAWLNEGREIDKAIFDSLQGRAGRYPKKKRDPKTKKVIYKPTWHGVILDSNPPDTDHWWYHLFEKEKPKNAILYRQPSGLSPQAENIDNLADGYYENLMIGKSEDYIRVYIEGEYGYIREGKPVWANYKDGTHLAKEPLKGISALPLIIGMDFGLTPAAVLTQQDPKGRLLVLDELFLPKTYLDVREFVSRYLKPLLREKYTNFKVTIVGDPAGQVRSQLDSRTVYQELRSLGLMCKSARSNSLQPRLGSVNFFLTRMVEGSAAFMLSPTCELLRKAMQGDYHFRRMMVSDERYTDVPDKNDSSHLADALQYACMEHQYGFDGTGQIMIGSGARKIAPPVEAWT